MESAGSRRTAIVTGGAGGIGSAIVRHLLLLGHRVAVVDVKPCDIDGYGDEDLLSVVSDVSDRAAADESFAEIERWSAPVTMLVTCAGIAKRATAYEMSQEVWQTPLDVHLTGTFNWCQNVGRHMRDHEGGSIVTFGSTTGTRGFPMRLSYGVAKAAIHQLTRGLAVEWADDGIRVNSIAPGYVATDTMLQGMSLTREEVDSLQALDRIGDPEEIASAVGFLLSSASSYMTGQVVVVDGGYSIMARPRGM